MGVGVWVSVSAFTSATPLFEEVSQTVLVRRIVSTARSVCLSTYSQTFDSQFVRCGVSTAGSVCLFATDRPLLDEGTQTHSLSDVVYPLLDLSVCSPQPDLCWTRALSLTVCQM